MNALHIIEAILSAVGMAYGIMTSIANAQPTTKVGLFCARWAGTAKHVVEAKPEIEAVATDLKAIKK